MAAIGQDEAWAGPETEYALHGLPLGKVAMNLFLNSI